MKRVMRFSVALVALVGLSCSSIFSPTESEENQTRSEEFRFAWQFLDVFFIFRDRLPENPFIYDTPSELYESVDEPYTQYVPPEFSQQFLSNLSTQSAGLGVRLDSTATGWVIKDVYPNSPASSAGLMQGDTIVAVNGTSIEGMPYAQLQQLLPGNIGETRRLQIHRNDQELTVEVAIGTFLAPSVFVDSLAPDIAQILITSFFDSTGGAEGGTAEEFDRALDQTRWAENTIIDLRENPGGQIGQSIDVISEFLQPGTEIARVREREYIRSRNVGITVDTVWVSVDVGGDAVGRDFYLLMNENTASAAELMITSLQTNRPEIVTIGQKTFGKGRGQIVSLSPDSGIVSVTYATIDPLTGVSYDQSGITPQVVIGDDESAVEVTVDRIEQTTVPAKRRRLAVHSALYSPSLDRLRARLKGQGWMYGDVEAVAR
jgi:carboxyl-terminal processing protease